MTVNISTNARNLAGNAIVDLIDLGTTAASGYIEIRDGTKPANPQTAATGNELATLMFSNPAFADFVNGQAYANAITSETDVTVTGTASWFRVYDRDGTAIFDGDVSEAGGGGDIIFDSTLFIRGGTVAITALLAVMPE